MWATFLIVLIPIVLISMPKLKIADIHLYYETAGRGQPVLFLHGLGSSSRDWESQVRVCSKHYQTMTVDLRGHGQSDKPRGAAYGIPLFASDTAALLQALGLGPAHVVGLSMGGMVAFQLALNSPQQVKSLVIVNSQPELKLRTWQERMNGLTRLLIIKLLGMRKMGQVLSKKLFPEASQVDLRAAFIARWADNDARAYYRTLKSLIGWSVAERLSEISCRTLVIGAGQDYTSTAFKQGYVDQMPNATLVTIQNARHFLPLERPDAFNQVLMEFLSDVDASVPINR
jgi:3-oxoadipate enol-lactonase